MIGSATSITERRAMAKKTSGGKFQKFKRENERISERDKVEERRTPKKKPRAKK